MRNVNTQTVGVKQSVRERERQAGTETERKLQETRMRNMN